MGMKLNGTEWNGTESNQRKNDTKLTKPEDRSIEMNEPNQKKKAKVLG